MSAEPVPHLELVACAECHKLKEKLKDAEARLEAQQEIALSEKAKAKRWKKMLDDKQKAHPDYTLVEALFMEWCKESGRENSTLDSQRIQAGLRGLKKYTPRELMCCIRGGCRNGFTDPKTKVAYNQFGRLLANSDAIELNIERYERWCEQNNVRFDRGPTLAEMKAREKAQDRMSTVRPAADNPSHDGSSRPKG